MSATPFEYEERYKVINPEATTQTLIAGGFVCTGKETQIDHWFIPFSVTSSEGQSQWFDFDKGYALRIREQTTTQGVKNIITAKQLINPGDHSSMTNHESILTVAGAREVLSFIGEEFSRVLDVLRDRQDDEALSYLEAKNLIELSGRREYITLDKERSTFQNPSVQDVVIDLDVIPALSETALGHQAALEIEYTGDAPLEGAREVVRSVSRELGYDNEDILKKALPGQAIEYLAIF